jgi:uncharacterized protein (DUF58 family)
VAIGALADHLAAWTPPRRGRGHAPALFEVLERVQPGGRTDLDAGLRGWPRQRGAGIAILLTDLLYAEGPDQALRRLRAAGNEVHVLHLLSPADLRPELDGDVVLVDAETGDELPLSVDPEVLDVYEATVRAWAEEMARTCARLGVGYTRVPTTVDLEQLVLGELRRAGLLTW